MENREMLKEMNEQVVESQPLAYLLLKVNKLDDA